MPFPSREYLELARELSERMDEAALRSAISRAYYGALGAASAFLVSEGYAVPADGSRHQFVWETFSDSPDDRRYYIGEDGLWLRRNRNTADYSAEMDDLLVRAKKSIVKARSILSALERIQQA